jgi:hypothetical protein
MSSFGARTRDFAALGERGIRFSIIPATSKSPLIYHLQCCNIIIRPDKKSPCALCIFSHPQLTATAMLDVLGMSDAMRYLPTLTIFLSSLLHIQRWEKFRAKVNARQWVVMHLMFASLVYALPPHSAVASFGRALTLFHCTVAYAVSRSAHFSHPWRSSRTQLCQR